MVKLPVSDEADEALDAASDQKRIDVGQVIANEEGRAAGGNVLLPDYADAVNGMGQQPKGEANQEIGQDG